MPERGIIPGMDSRPLPPRASITSTDPLERALALLGVAAAGQVDLRRQIERRYAHDARLRATAAALLGELADIEQALREAMTARHTTG